MDSKNTGSRRRMVDVPQAPWDIELAQQQVIVLTPDEQLAFWTLLNQPPKLTPEQRKLGAVMRGET